MHDSLSSHETSIWTRHLYWSCCETAVCVQFPDVPGYHRASVADKEGAATQITTAGTWRSQVGLRARQVQKERLLQVIVSILYTTPSSIEAFYLHSSLDESAMCAPQLCLSLSVVSKLHSRIGDCSVNLLIYILLCGMRYHSVICFLCRRNWNRYHSVMFSVQTQLKQQCNSDTIICVASSTFCSMLY